MRSVILAMALFLSIPLYAVVDMKNANYSETWTDINIPGSGYQLKVERVYNSRSLFNGIFGFGWCSDYETSLSSEADGGLRLTVCGGGLEVKYTAKNFDPSKTKSHYDNLIKLAAQKNSSLSKAELDRLRKDIEGNTFMRVALEQQVGFKGSSPIGKTFFANGKEADFIEHKGDSYIRHLTDGTRQKFNMKGQLTHMYDRNGNYLKISYNKKQLSTIVDNNGRQLVFKYYPGKDKVKSINGPGKIAAAYKFKDEDLSWSKNQWSSEFSYDYDNFHNLTKVTFPDKRTKKLTYNTETDWITSFTNLKGCVETYKYDIDKKSGGNHYWSRVTKKCDNKVTNQSEFEFWYKTKTHQYGKYLYRVKSNINGKKTDITYHHIFGKPIATTINGATTTFDYFDNGFIHKKKERYRNMAYKYDTKCSKVAEIKTEYYKRIVKREGNRVATSVSKKPIKITKTNFKYQKVKCNLEYASNTDGQKVWLDYDSKGRIQEIKDQSKKIVKITYNEKFGKPLSVYRPGLGKITVSYNSNGEINKVISKQGPRIAVQVANVFNNLLEIISPATTDLAL